MPFIQYEQFRVNINFTQISKLVSWLIMCFKWAFRKKFPAKILRIVHRHTKLYAQLYSGSLACSKSVCYMARAASTKRFTTDQLLQSVSMEYIINTYNITKELKFDISDTFEKSVLYEQFLAWNCEGCSITPLSDYTNSCMSCLKVLPEKSQYLQTIESISTCEKSKVTLAN